MDAFATYVALAGLGPFRAARARACASRWIHPDSCARSDSVHVGMQRSSWFLSRGRSVARVTLSASCVYVGSWLFRIILPWLLLSLLECLGSSSLRSLAQLAACSASCTHDNADLVQPCCAAQHSQPDPLHWQPSSPVLGYWKLFQTYPARWCQCLPLSHAVLFDLVLLSTPGKLAMLCCSAFPPSLIHYIGSHRRPYLDTGSSSKLIPHDTVSLLPLSHAMVVRPRAAQHSR